MNFASVEDTRSRLSAAGFSRHPGLAHPHPVTPSDPRGYVSTVILPWHLDRLPPELHDAFERAVIETAPRPLRSPTSASTSRPRRERLRRTSPSCRATGSAPRSSRPQRQVLDAVGDFTYEEHLVGGASIDEHGIALTDEVLETAARPTPSCSAPSAGRSGTRPTRTSRGPSRASSACARASASSRTSGRSARARRSSTPARCAPRSSRAPTSSSCASSPAASTSARRSASRLGARHLRLHARRDRAHRPGRLRGRRPARRPRHLGRQGERPRNVTPLARGRDRDRTPTTPTSRSTTCSSTTPRCSSSPARAAST